MGVGTTGRAVGVGSAETDGVGTATGVVVGTGVGSALGVESGATTGEVAALVNRVLRKMPPMSPKRIKTLIVDPIRITARLVITFPSCVRLADDMERTRPR